MAFGVNIQTLGSKKPKKPVVVVPPHQLDNRNEVNQGYSALHTPAGMTTMANYKAGVDQNAENMRMAGITPSWSQPTPAAPKLPGSPSSGGSGGGVNTQAEALKQLAFFMDLIKGGALNPQQQTFTPETYTNQTYTPDTALYDRVSQGVTADKANANNAYDQLDQYLQSMGPNAYQTLPQAQGPQADQSMLDLLGSQGIDPAAYKAQAAFNQSQGQSGADAYNRMVQMLAAGETANRQSRGAESQMGRAYSGQELDAQALGLNTKLDISEQARKRQIEDANAQGQSAVSARNAANQLALQQANTSATTQSQQQKLAMYTQLAQIAAAAGLNMPTMQQLGLA